MKLAASIAVFAIALTSSGAMAAPVITFNQGSGAQILGTTVIEDFEGYTTGASLGTNAFALNNTSGSGARPAYGSTGNYGSVLGGGAYSISFGPTSQFAFALGSLDGYNSLTLQFANATTATYNGAAIVGGLPPANGDQGAAYTNGIVSFDAAGGPKITGAVFTSGQNSFEFDDLATGGAVPEPATWAMMLLGFGAIGSAMRRRRNVRADLVFA